MMMLPLLTILAAAAATDPAAVADICCCHAAAACYLPLTLQLPCGAACLPMMLRLLLPRRYYCRSC
jgi:hypothetical protein